MMGIWNVLPHLPAVPEHRRSIVDCMVALRALHDAVGHASGDPVADGMVALRALHDAVRRASGDPVADCMIALRVLHDAVRHASGTYSCLTSASFRLLWPL